MRYYMIEWSDNEIDYAYVLRANSYQNAADEIAYIAEGPSPIPTSYQAPGVLKKGPSTTVRGAGGWWPRNKRNQLLKKEEADQIWDHLVVSGKRLQSTATLFRAAGFSWPFRDRAPLTRYVFRQLLMAGFKITYLQEKRRSE